MSRPAPIITDVAISQLEVNLTKAFEVSISAGNNGDNADMQAVSISFTNLTSINSSTLRIINSNFTQKPFVVNYGDDIGSNYQGLSKTVPARIPSLEFYSRPWKADKVYNVKLEVVPYSLGNFTLFVKAVAFPHKDNSSHYHRVGIKDYQQEYVNSYHVLISSNK